MAAPHSPFRFADVDELLTVEGVTKRFGDRCALKNVSFSVRRGEALGLIGPNGAGKTTLLECLAGLTPADAGSGKVGVWSKTDSVSYFDDFTVTR